MLPQVGLSVIIVNFNTAEWLTNCLRSVMTQSDISYEVFVVDNASTDHSVATILDQFPQVRLFANKENLGFAKANNLAAREARGRYIYYLSPDTVVQPGCFSAMLRFMEANPYIGMAGTKLLFPDNTPQNSVEKRYPGQRHAGAELAGLPGSIAWLLGASLIARREVIETVGGFSEDFFLYGEDIDLGLKVRQAGWELGFIPDAKVIHWEGKSERHTLPLDVFRKKLTAEALFYQRHYSAKTIVRICRANIRQARWRLFSLLFEKIFAQSKSNHESVATKRDRYRASLSFFLKLSAEIGSITRHAG